MTREALGDLIAPLNAGFNLLTVIFLIAGLIFVRNGRVALHRKSMLGAVSSSAIFLVLYVTRFALTGTHRFAGEGLAKTIYLMILFSHMVLAVVIVPLVLRLLQLAFSERYQEHRRLARWTYPIWMYVSLTGLAVYALLYHVYGYL